MVNLQEISEALIVGNAKKVRELVEQALKEGVSPKEILDKALVPGMNVVGEKFKNNEYYVPEVLIAARAMHAGMDPIKPLLTQTGASYVGKVVIGTVRGDLHDIGKNLVAMMLEGAGFQIIDLGVDVPPEKFVEVAKNENVDIVAMSALLTTTMLAMKDTINALKEAGIRDKVKVMIGGAPVTQRYADEIGADGYAPDAATAVEKAKELLGLN
jgi:5-methyltetrahydrofolate--homocysteine methyltransferase